MKKKISITIKFIFLATIFLVLITVSLLSNLFFDTNAYLEKNISDKVDLYGDLFDSYFGNLSRLSNDNYTDNITKSFIKKNNDIVLSLDIAIIDGNTIPSRLIIVESDNPEKINSTPSHLDLHLEALDSFRLVYEKIKGTNNYVVVEPIYSEEVNGYIGTYEMIISLESDINTLETYRNNTINTAIFSFLVLIIGSILIVYALIQKPLSKLKLATIKLGKGNLDTRVNIKSRDEFGDLSDTFNKMAEDIKKSQNKIEEYNRILEKLLEQKDEFIGQLGHDLKNPMQPLVGLLPILIEKEKDPENKEMLEVMNANVEYMQDLIFDTLKLAKLRSDNIDFNYKNLNLKEISNKVIKSQKTMLEEKNITIINKIKEDIFVFADKLRLSEVFKNLINNSVKYTKDSGGKITIDAEYQNKNFVKISIKDTGIGMKNEQLKKVFDEFYKADRQTSDYHSTGLGLAICKRIVDKHGGKIWVNSRGPGMGSTFYFTIKKEKEGKNK